MLIKDLTETMHKKSKEIVNIYEDYNESFKTENAVFSGSTALKKDDAADAEGEDNGVWDNFYAKLEEVDVSIECLRWIVDVSQYLTVELSR